MDDDKIIDLLEEHDWNAYKTDGRISEIEAYSPLGEGIVIDIPDDATVYETVRDYAFSFDANGHVLDLVRNPPAGAPENVRDLCDDADAIQRMLDELVDALRKAA